MICVCDMAVGSPNQDSTENTETVGTVYITGSGLVVAPTKIRQRILKLNCIVAADLKPGQVAPTKIRQRILKHVSSSKTVAGLGVAPTKIRQRILKRR